MLPDIGTVRETFALNQLKNATQKVYLPKQGDILVEDGATQIVFEIGGKGKDAKQLNGESNGYILADDIELGFLKKIPLYILGFLY